MSVKKLEMSCNFTAMEIIGNNLVFKFGAILMFDSIILAY